MYTGELGKIPPKSGLYAIGTRVNHGCGKSSGHGTGTIIGYNTQTCSPYIPEFYPYVIKYDWGYVDVYSPGDFILWPDGKVQP